MVLLFYQFLYFCKRAGTEPSLQCSLGLALRLLTVLAEDALPSELLGRHILLVSVACLALGLYLFVNAPRSISEPADVLLNPAVLLASIGLISGFVSIFGMFGALRDNVFLLKLFALCVFFGYLLLVVSTCLLFLLFYSDVSGESSTFISIQSVLLHSIARYHSNKNYADFIDYLQEQVIFIGFY
uniref:Uncharacterized protein n=1 Tax=Meloidogyne incognita TaxID=6306 RepID=A0A914NCG4_MELIC